MAGLLAKYWNTRLLAPLVAALACAGAASGAAAQSASDFRLQPGSSAPRAQGPVDPDNPAPAPSVAAPAPVASAPLPVPTITPPPPDQKPVARATAGSAPRPTATSGPAPAPVAPRPAATAVPEPAQGPVAAAPVSGITESAAIPVPMASAPAAAVPAGGEGGAGWWWLVPVVLAGAGGIWAWRRRRHEDEVPQIVPPRAVRDGAAREGDAAPEPAPETGNLLEPSAPLATAPAGTSALLLLLLAPERLSVSLVTVTLHYRLIVTNPAAHALGPVAIAADMIGAHASLSAESQLGQDGAGLELRHELPALAPGESAEVRGELRLPLAEITPIRAGAATLLVPLVRLRAEADGLSLTQAVVVGETPLVPGAPLRPFRLDTGPRIFGAVSQREIALAA